jgi:putative phosphoribosyl transferase
MTPSPITERPHAATARESVDVEPVVVRVGSLDLAGDLAVPTAARGVVVFAHGSGSSRLSPRNRAVAAALNDGGLATLLFDLLTVAEEADRSNVFDIPLLGRRLADATRWLRDHPPAQHLPIAYFGASTGAAAALWAAAERGVEIASVVSRGGRPDLAAARLEEVRAPTLLIVGGLDTTVLALNADAQSHLRCANRLEIVPGATHLFEERGALDRVATLALDWFVRWFDPGRRSDRDRSLPDEG